MQLKAGDHVREHLEDRGHPKEHRTPGVLIFNMVNTNREIPEMPLSAKISDDPWKTCPLDVHLHIR